MKARVVMDRAEFASTLSRLASEIEAKVREKAGSALPVAGPGADED